MPHFLLKISKSFVKKFKQNFIDSISGRRSRYNDPDHRLQRRASDVQKSQISSLGSRRANKHQVQLNWITLGRIKSENINQMIQLTDVILSNGKISQIS